MEELNNLWTEKFRPKTTKQIILPSKVKRMINKIISSKTLPNLILYNQVPGCGKSSLAKSLCHDLGYEYLYLNGSLSANIDMLRTDIKNFCQTQSLESDYKVVIIDDIGSNSLHGFQPALKVFVEEYSKTCRFIITTNSLSYIIEPIQSRFEIIKYNFEDKAVRDELIPTIRKAFSGLLKKMEIPFEEEGLNQLIENSYPDIRQILRSLQIEYLENGQITKEVLKISNVDFQFYQLLLDRKLTDARKYLIEKQVDYREMYGKMFREMVPLFESKAIQAQVMLKIQEYMDQHTRTLDPEITFTALLIEIISLMK